MDMGNNFNHLDLERELAAQREEEELQHRKRQLALAVLIGVLVAVVVVAAALVVTSSNGAGGVSGTEISVPATSSNNASSESASGEGKAAKSDSSSTAEDTTGAKLESVIGDIGNASAAKLGIYVAAADGSWEAGYNENRAQRSASMIKVAIMGALFQQIDAGEIDLSDTHTVTSGEIVGGTGTIQNSGEGKTYTVRELVKLMISVSDNTATNIIIDMAGMKAVNSYAKAQGLTETKLNRKMMDTDAPKENYTSAYDLGVLFKQIAGGTFASKKLNALALEALNEQSDSFGFAKGLPSSVGFAHKTGTLSAARNDGGITQGDEEVVMVLLADETDESEAQSIATKVAKAVTKQLGW